MIVFPGETTAQDFLQLHLPDNNHKIDSTSQHQLQLLLDSALWSSLKDSASLRDRARPNTISGQQTGAWLRAVSNPNLGLSMPKREFSVALRIWLGIPIFSFPNSKRCPRGNTVDKFGDHLLGCNQGQSFTTKRHDALCEVVYNALLTDDSHCRRGQDVAVATKQDQEMFTIPISSAVCLPTLTYRYEALYDSLFSFKRQVIQVLHPKLEGWRRTNDIT